MFVRASQTGRIKRGGRTKGIIQLYFVFNNLINTIIPSMKNQETSSLRLAGWRLAGWNLITNCLDRVGTDSSSIFPLQEHIINRQKEILPKSKRRLGDYNCSHFFGYSSQNPPGVKIMCKESGNQISSFILANI